MNVSVFLNHLHNINTDLQVFIASTVLMPLASVQSSYVNGYGEIIELVQQRYIDEDNPSEYRTVSDLITILTDHEDMPVLLLANYHRDIEMIRVKKIGDTKKVGRNKIVAVEDAWDSHPVHEETIREALIIYTPL